MLIVNSVKLVFFLPFTHRLYMINVELMFLFLFFFYFELHPMNRISNPSPSNLYASQYYNYAIR